MADLEALLAIMARLRDPEGGCPWDLEQDFSSISPHTIEEAYEVDEAIASGDLEALRDELGDLLFQVVFQARLAQEQGAFDFAGVIDAIVTKLVRRHPHIFAEAQTPSTARGQRDHWESIKAAERAEASGDSGEAPDPFAGIPRSLPALARSVKVASRIERHREGAAPSIAALRAEAEAAYRALGLMLDEADVDSGSFDPDRAEGRRERIDSIGRGLTAWVRLARGLGVDPEQALRRADDEAMAEVRSAVSRENPSNVHQASNSRLR